MQSALMFISPSQSVLVFIAHLISVAGHFMHAAYTGAVLSG